MQCPRALANAATVSACAWPMPAMAKHAGNLTRSSRCAFPLAGQIHHFSTMTGAQNKLIFIAQQWEDVVQTGQVDVSMSCDAVHCTAQCIPLPDLMILPARPSSNSMLSSTGCLRLIARMLMTQADSCVAWPVHFASSCAVPPCWTKSGPCLACFRCAVLLADTLGPARRSSKAWLKMPPNTLQPVLAGPEQAGIPRRCAAQRQCDAPVRPEGSGPGQELLPGECQAVCPEPQGAWVVVGRARCNDTNDALSPCSAQKGLEHRNTYKGWATVCCREAAQVS